MVLFEAPLSCYNYDKFLHICIPDEKVIMNPRDDTKVGKLEDPVHDPHDFVSETLS